MVIVGTFLFRIYQTKTQWLFLKNSDTPHYYIYFTYTRYIKHLYIILYAHICSCLRNSVGYPDFKLSDFSCANFSTPASWSLQGCSISPYIPKSWAFNLNEPPIHFKPSLNCISYLIQSICCINHYYIKKQWYEKACRYSAEMRILRTFPLCAGLGSMSSGLIFNSPSLPSRRHGKSPHATSSTSIEAWFLFLRFIYFYMYECSVHRQCLQRPERTSELLILESVKAVRHHVAWVWVLRKSCPVMSPVLRLWPCLLPHKLHPIVSSLLPPPWLLNCLFSLPRKAWVAFHGQIRSSSAASTALKKNPTPQIHSQARPSFATLSFPQGWALFISMCAFPLPLLFDSSSSCVPS